MRLVLFGRLKLLLWAAMVRVVVVASLVGLVKMAEMDGGDRTAIL